MYDYLIVGSGLYGSTFAHLAKQDGKRCLVIDKRNHLGGNCYCSREFGIDVHKYGAHIFHTSDERVWNFVNQFVEFNNYINQPVANYKGRIYNLPFNMNTFAQMWGISKPKEAREIIKRQTKKVPSKIDNLEQQAISLVGKDIYKKLIKEYTEKQWGRKCKDLPPDIIKRLPVRFTYDNNYFNDRHQGIPVGGYNKLIEGLLEGIEARTDIDFFKDKKLQTIADKIVFTGRIDEYFNFKFGKLKYRTVRFEDELMIGVQNYQGNAVVNYTSHKEPYTRIIEHKHFEPEAATYSLNKTFISKEYSQEWKEGLEPFYPINDDENQALYLKYKELSEKEPNVIFGGRLAEYKYYDMDDVILKAMLDYEKIRGLK